MAFTKTNTGEKFKTTDTEGSFIIRGVSTDQVEDQQ